jgi:hypothetical protein
VGRIFINSSIYNSPAHPLLDIFQHFRPQEDKKANLTYKNLMDAEFMSTQTKINQTTVNDYKFYHY